ncbi:MAG: 2OG-Fe(II) oxygenase, partial [Pyrinomonadaceae bacterium]
IHQRRKLTQRSGFPPPIESFFALTAADDFRELIGQICGIPKLIDDPELIGGGLHQILGGGFLDVHVDYNYHPKTKLHRRLNLLLYLNKEWRPEYHGHLELWDLQARRQLESIAPEFNRVVIFETNEISYHGHPQPLNTPPHVTRKSLAIYYYTEARDDGVLAPDHNTLYRQTTGLPGVVKTLASGTRAVQERLSRQGPGALVRNLAKRAYRRAQGLPPENKSE